MKSNAKKIEELWKKGFKELKESIDKRTDFYREIKISKKLDLDTQDDIAQYILNKLKQTNVYVNSEVLNLFQIPKSYKEKVNIEKHMIQSHLNKYKKNELYKPTTKSKSNQTEKTICKRLWEQDYMYEKGEGVNKPNSKMNIIDFEVPVIYSKYSVENGKDTNNRCSGNGAVDLVAKAGNILYLIEAKDYKSEESLLRCIAEIRTYYEKIINHKKRDREHLSAEEILKYSYGVSKIVPAIMIFEDTQPYDNLKEISHCKYLNKLAKDIIFFKIKFKDDKNNKNNKKKISVDRLKLLDFVFEKI